MSMTLSSNEATDPTSAPMVLESDGFTLLELLFVIAIMAILLSVMPHFISVPSSLHLRSAATGLATDLRALRDFATGRHVSSSLTLAGNRYLLQPGGIVREFPGGVTATLHDDTPDLLGRSLTSVVFFADGSASGGTVLLIYKGLQASVRIRWVNGGVSIDAK